MKKQKVLNRFIGSIVLAVCFSLPILAQSQARTEAALPEKANPIASIATAGSAINWNPQVTYASLVLTVSTPGGDVIRRTFKAGTAPSLALIDDKGINLPDGQYAYELVLIPEVPRNVAKQLAAAREKGDATDVMRELQRNGLLPARAVAQSGFFRIEKGVAFVGAPEEGVEPRNVNQSPEAGKRATSQSRKGGGEGGFVPLDQVFADDLIVQGSACVGLDCVNNESFGFDTLRLKENNTRIKFDDTSTGTGFPANDWQLTANDSASGGANKFSIEDITGSRVPFTITAGAPTNAVFVDSIGRLGLRTATPTLDVHVATGDTPAFRMEQTGTSGFTAQTWDIGANEANFFVRDLTGGSRLPFRIRPGAPTSSIDINASGNVGIGTASPSSRLHVVGGNNTNAIFDGGATTHSLIQFTNAGTGRGFIGFANLGSTGLAFFNAAGNTINMLMTDSGNLGLGGLQTPTNPIQHNNGAKLTAGGVWTNASSRSLKMNIHSLTAREAFDTLRGLAPVKFQYKAAPGEHHVGFIAEDVPELVAASDRKSLSPMDVVAVLTKVVQEQQQTIAELKEKVAHLEKAELKKTRHQRRR